MTRAIEQRLRKLELGTNEPRRLRFVFSATSDEADWDSQIAEMIRTGQACAEDEFMRIGWMPGSMIAAEACRHS
jgi:hypothetical protein